jgi:hypothetical protein
MAEDLDHGMQPRERDEKERTFIIEPALQNDGPGRSLPAAARPCILRGNGGSSGALSGSFLATLRYDPYVSKGLVRDDHARTQWSAGRLSVELIDDTVGEPRNSGKEAPIVAKEQPECFRHRENGIL